MPRQTNAREKQYINNRQLRASGERYAATSQNLVN